MGIWLVRWIAASVILGLAAPAQAQQGCGVGEVSSGRVHMRVMAQPENGRSRVNYVHVAASDSDRAYRLSVNYDPTPAGLGPPTLLYVDIYFSPPDLRGAGSEQIAWRTGSGAWFNPRTWGEPMPTSSGPGDARMVVHHQMARSPRSPLRPELLETLAHGVRFQFRRFDLQGQEIGSGAVDYPPEERIAAMYETARAEAMANLGPCGRPLYIHPAPAPPAPERQRPG